MEKSKNRIFMKGKQPIRVAVSLALISAMNDFLEHVIQRTKPLVAYYHVFDR